MLEIKVLDKVAGYLREDGTFIKYVKEENIYRKLKGVGISYDVLIKLEKANVRRIVILIQFNDGTTRKYESTVTDFMEKGILVKNGYADFQRIMPFNTFAQKTLIP